MKVFLSHLLRVAHLLISLIISLQILCGCSGEEIPQKTIFSDSAAIACSDPVASRIGLTVLRSGGNAIDALIAVISVMSVNYWTAGSLGGGGFLVYRTADGEVTALDFRETAPAAASVDMYWGEDGKPVSDLSRYGGLAVATPGVVKGLAAAHEKWGSKAWKPLWQPAIELAEDGFLVSEYMKVKIESKLDKLSRYPSTARIFLPDGKAPRAGYRLVQSDLAETLRQVADHGESAFYRGPVAEKIVEAARRHGGILTMADLENYQIAWRKPVEFDYRGYRLYSMPLPSSGGLILQGLLNSLSHVDLKNSYAHNSPDYVALLTEIEKQWFAKRNLHLGDPDFVEVPTDLFADAAIAAAIASSVSVDGPLDARELPEFELLTHVPVESPETTHISIVDQLGNAVSLTYTLNGRFGSCLVAEGTGLFLNNQMDDFTSKPGFPNLFGLRQSSANAIEPGKRMLSSMTPTIVEKDGELVGLLGTPGGATIITTVLQVLLSKVDYRLTLAEAVDANRYHHQWLPDRIQYEADRVDQSLMKELEARGFGFQPWQLRTIGDVQAVWRDGNRWEVSSDPRENGLPTGY